MHYTSRFYCGANNSPWYKCSICNTALVACVLIIAAGVWMFIKLTPVLEYLHNLK